ncbi:saccharopine dehydrogenase family protein [Mesoterricola sediminis]|uniref:Saccharopine reductase n=1 Tax=Mesoterricola sediminis TaxID=2927980 RepID=A0AA48KDD9_9BACT|nr:saccharopine dehydrogenase C-terminal domain-containing protein [Mesoterricola sediminis]BDU76970.1 saccharopine reductase [Mesoterricola sediminis]
MKRICVLGAGRVGATLALDLAQDGAFEVTVADRSHVALDRLAAKGLRTHLADLAQPGAVQEAVAGCDLAVGAVPGFMGFTTLQAVLEAGRPMVDISFFPEDPFRLDGLARDKGLVAVMDAGVAPGCDNFILGDVVRRVDRVTSFECYVGGLPVVRTWPFEYKAGFSPVDVVEEYTRPARYVAHGQEIVMPALSEPELMDFPGIGTLEAFNTDGLRSIIRTVKAPFMKEKTLRYPGHIEKMRMLREAGFFSTEPVELNGVPVAPMDLTTRLLFPLWQMGEGDEDFTVMRVIVAGEKDGRPVRETWDLLDRYDRATGTTSMARTTGYTCTATVRLVAEGLWSEPGVAPPEVVGMKAGCWDFIRRDLAKRGVQWTRRDGTACP